MTARDDAETPNMPAQSLSPTTINRKKGTACHRCRNQKIRCDNGQGACTNCTRANHSCVRPNSATAAHHIQHLEARLLSLEQSISRPSATVSTRDPVNDSISAHTSSNDPPLPPDSDLAISPVAVASGFSTLPPISASPFISLATVANDTNSDVTALPAAHEADATTHVRHGSHGYRPDETIHDAAGRGSAGLTMPNLPTHGGHGGPHQHLLRSTTHGSLGSLGRLSNSVENHTPPSEPSPATTTQITPSEPLAHVVGLFSLANAKESKYLGPSSGVPFARLILTAIPQSQGLLSSLATPSGGPASSRPSRPELFPDSWVFDVDLQHFVDVYFETHQPLYPFLDEESVYECLESLYTDTATPLSTHRLSMSDFSKMPQMQSVQILLIMALGARMFESRLSVDFSSERYLATAMSRIGDLFLHESTEGLQVMLLLTLCSFSFVDGPNAWFLVSNIIAACVDLGLQRRLQQGQPGQPGARHVTLTADGQGLDRARENVRRGVFWSAYSLERTLAVVLGRPLTLRDEAFDIEFPGIEDIAVSSRDRCQAEDPHANKRRRLAISSPYTAAQYSFRFDQLTAEMKLMLYRVRNRPGCFPWLTDVDAWQKDAHRRCDELVDAMRHDLKWRRGRQGFEGTIPILELKYHHCLMLLHRPSPATPRPCLASWRICYHSAVQTILVSADLGRFSKLTNSWLNGHTIFVSGMTFLYCLWAKQEIKRETTLEAFQSHAAACIGLLRVLAKTWSVAAGALEKYEKLVQLTTASWWTTDASVAAGPDAAPNGLSTPQTPAQATQPSSSLPVDADPPPIRVDPISRGNDVGLESQYFFDELGDVGMWFDLDWMKENGAQPDFY